MLGREHLNGESRGEGVGGGEGVWQEAGEKH